MRIEENTGTQLFDEADLPDGQEQTEGDLPPLTEEEKKNLVWYAREHNDHKRKAAQHASNKKDMADRVRALMGGREELLIGDFLIRITPGISAGIDKKAMKEDGILSKYQTEKETEKMTIEEIVEEGEEADYED